MHRIIRHTALLMLLASCGKAGHSSATPGLVDSAAAGPSTRPAPDSVSSRGVPRAVADVGTHGEDLYDHVKAGNWPTARATMDSLDQSAAAVTGTERVQLAGLLDTLRRAVDAHQRQTALVAANRVTLIGAALTEPYSPRVPADVVRLDYYGRELEIWAARNDMAKLTATSAGLRRTWDAVKPTVVSHGGAVAAARTDSLVARLAVAKRASDYAKLATPFLDVVDQLEKPFEG
ncbi:MAG: hypothetical protein JWN53_1392 [Gemmatimonadetes bacterium]|jgi:hypothetical protein|nr:hypothetical protein [Gemmatimonadota bacterium]